ncbi:ACP phosphodiesterase [Pseudoalteromonas sp. T1lg65]|uniref:acyl carrier protein phosphodiesterase n=1 Tax=Pseudoalteromonas sp. T1lg65 TaxID=2077101 RepID=UPI003F79D051
MNYLGHLYFAEPTSESYVGNLLGDFRKGVSISELPKAVKQGLATHHLIDKYTDNSPLTHSAKQYFSDHRRRFSGVALDVLYDHFLIKHWSDYHHQPFIEFKQDSYQLLANSLNIMPPMMRQVMISVVSDDWLATYESVAGVGIALDNIARRLRFANRFDGCIEDIDGHYKELEQHFRQFMPQLISHVSAHKIEN